MIIRTKKEKSNYVMVDLKMINDERLSFIDLGIMVTLLVGPEAELIEKFQRSRADEIDKLIMLGYLETA